MPTYKNLSKAVKTFYGVTFLPGEVKSVSGYINDRHFVKVAEPKKKELEPIQTVVKVEEPKQPIMKPIEEKKKPTRKYTKKSKKES